MEIIRNQELKLSELSPGSLFELKGSFYIKERTLSFANLCCQVGSGVIIQLDGDVIVVELLIKK